MTIDPAIVERVLACVDERAIVALASDLIRIPSFKPDETPVAAYLSDFFRERSTNQRIAPPTMMGDESESGR